MRVERVIALAMIASTYIAAHSARAQDHLGPESSNLFAYRDFRIFGDYYQFIREELLIIEDDQPYVAVLEIRAFWPEWAVLLHRPSAGKARVEVRRATIPIWERLWEEREPAPIWRRLLTRKKPVGFTIFEASVLPDTADAVAKVWELFLRETRFPPPSDSVCFDCLSQHFSLATDQGFLTGSLHGIPSWCSRVGELLNLVYLLRRFAVVPESARPAEQEIFDRAMILADPAKLEARIDQCKADHAARPSLKENSPRISRHLEDLAEWQYCFCGSWPTSGADLKFFDDLYVAQRRRGDEPNASSYYPDFDYSSVKLSADQNGPLHISVSGYDRIYPVPECFDLPRESADEWLGPDHCPR